MAYTQFLTPEYFFDNDYLPNNIDTQLINRSIRKAQDIEIKNVLGYNLYSKLMNDFANNGEWVDKYLELMKVYVYTALAEWTMFHILPDIHQRITNQTLEKRTNDNAVASSLEEMKYKREIQFNTAIHYTDLIRQYLKANQNDFPELYSDSCFNNDPSVKSGSTIWTSSRSKRMYDYKKNRRWY